MRRVVAKQKKEARKFALAQAKARAHLLGQGGAAAASAAKQMGLTDEEASKMQAKLGSGADAGKNAVSNAEMEKLKKALKDKDDALGGMKKQMELMSTS